MGTIIPMEDIEKLEEVIMHYDYIVANMGRGMNSNNEKFNKKLENLINGLYCEVN